jgi:hypothetical protein
MLTFVWSIVLYDVVLYEPWCKGCMSKRKKKGCELTLYSLYDKL